MTTTAPSSDPPGFRSPEMNDELEQLRQRGLAKSLNKHFTQECKKVEAERAAAERALTELEARKASVSKFAPSSDEYSQLEMMYQKVSAWKDECCKKEKETILLYQKMLRKFGSDIKLLASPEDLMTPRKDPPTNTPKTSPLVNLDVGSLAEAFRNASDGIPDFLRPTEASSPSSFNDQELEEILEDSSLPDPEAPCKAFVATPRTNTTEEMDSDYDDSSIVSGLTTLNSQVTREVLDGVQTKVMDFIHSETANIRKLMMLEEEDVGSKTGPSVAVSQSTSQVGSVEEHENMVIAMQKILENFKNVEAASEESLSEKMGRRIEAGKEGEEWFEHWDEAFQRHYYVEANSNTTQWEMPPTAAELSCTSSASLSASASSSKVEPKVLDYDFKPDVRGGRRRNRLGMYKKKQARKRKRQLAALVFVFAGMVAAFFYYKHVNPEQVEMAIEAVSATVTGGFTGTIDTPVSSGGRKTTATHVVVKESQQSKKKVESQTVAVLLEKVEQKEEIVKAPLPDKVESKSATITKEGATEEANGVTRPKVIVPDAPKEVKQAVVDQAKDMLNKSTQSASHRHWILNVFMGHEHYKKVSKMCGEPSRYCGDFRG